MKSEIPLAAVPAEEPSHAPALSTLNTNSSSPLPPFPPVTNSNPAPDGTTNASGQLQYAVAPNPNAPPSDAPPSDGSTIYGLQSPVLSPHLRPSDLGLPSALGHRPSDLPATQLSTLHTQLLTDLRQAFFTAGSDRIFTRDLLARLKALPDRLWKNLIDSHLQPQLWLADQLRPFGIRPRTLWIAGTCGKGYLRKEICPPANPQTAAPGA